MKWGEVSIKPSPSLPSPPARLQLTFGDNKAQKGAGEIILQNLLLASILQIQTRNKYTQAAALALPGTQITVCIRVAVCSTVWTGYGDRLFCSLDRTSNDRKTL